MVANSQTRILIALWAHFVQDAYYAFQRNGNNSQKKLQIGVSSKARSTRIKITANVEDTTKISHTKLTDQDYAAL